jgi:hypothetical protein
MREGGFIIFLLTVAAAVRIDSASGVQFVSYVLDIMLPNVPSVGMLKAAVCTFMYLDWRMFGGRASEAIRCITSACTNELSRLPRPQRISLVPRIALPVFLLAPVSPT